MLADLLDRVITPSRIRRIRAIYRGDFSRFRDALTEALIARSFTELDYEAQVACLNDTIRSLLAN